MMNRFNPYGNNGRGSIFSGRGYGPQGPGGNPMRRGRNQPTKKCSTHGKKRTMKNLEENEEGKWVCRSGFECRDATTTSSESNTGETAKCTLHDKTRTIANLGKNQNGEWVCLGSSLCKSGGNRSGYSSGGNRGYSGGFQRQQYGGWMTFGGGYGGGPLCSLHGKKRTLQNLVRNEIGLLVCAPGSRCKGAAGQELSTGPGMQICSVHGKRRSSSNLEQGDEGEWVCMERYKCKVVPEGAASAVEQTCTIHNKSRTTPNLEQNDDGEWVCIKGSMCK